MGKKKKVLLISLLVLVFAVTAAVITSAEYGDIIMNKNAEIMKQSGVKPVLFPHWFHRIRYKCKVCHEEIFIMEKGANAVNMEVIIDGKFCGACHNGLVAWEATFCDRCHAAEVPAESK